MSELFYKSQEITELREILWQDQQWFKQMSANITEMQKELDRIQQENWKLREEREKLIEGLRWYADEQNYDKGQRARNILHEIIDEALSTTTDKTCVICGKREGKYLSTADRWFCEPCTDALPPVKR